MNSLTQYLERNKMDECAVMNRLQVSGVISDNAIDARDVYELNAQKAVVWLIENGVDGKSGE